MGSDRLGCGRTVSQECRTSREDIIGEEPAIGIGRRSSRVEGQNVWKHGQRSEPGLIGRVPAILEECRPCLKIVLDIVGWMASVVVVFAVDAVEERVDGRVTFAIHLHRPAIMAQAHRCPRAEIRTGRVQHVVGHLQCDREHVFLGECVATYPREVAPASSASEKHGSLRTPMNAWQSPAEAGTASAPKLTGVDWTSTSPDGSIRRASLPVA